MIGFLKLAKRFRQIHKGQTEGIPTIIGGPCRFYERDMLDSHGCRSVRLVSRGILLSRYRQWWVSSRVEALNVIATEALFVITMNDCCSSSKLFYLAVRAQLCLLLLLHLFFRKHHFL